MYINHNEEVYVVLKGKLFSSLIAQDITECFDRFVMTRLVNACLYATQIKLEKRDKKQCK